MLRRIVAWAAETMKTDQSHVQVVEAVHASPHPHVSGFIDNGKNSKAIVVAYQTLAGIPGRIAGLIDLQALTNPLIPLGNLTGSYVSLA